MSEMHREPEVAEERVPVVECFDGPARITSEELATNSFCEKQHPPECLFYKSESGCRIWVKSALMHIVRLMNNHPCSISPLLGPARRRSRRQQHASGCSCLTNVVKSAPPSKPAPNSCLPTVAPRSKLGRLDRITNHQYPRLQS